MNNIVIVFGGASVEHDVSIITALQAYSNLKDDYIIDLVYISLDNEFYFTKFYDVKDYIDKDNIKKHSIKVDFVSGGLYKRKKKKLILIKPVEKVLNCCHGGVGEGGALSGFFEVNKILVSSADSSSSAICMNKNITKLLVNNIGISVVPFVELSRRDIDEKVELIKENLSDELIIKPNNLGSSIGIIKTNKNILKNDLAKVLYLTDSAIVEDYIVDMEELNCAVLKNGEDLCVSLIEKVEKKQVILSFEDKYCDRKSKREIPAQISEELKDKIYEYSKQIYYELNLSGVVRIDYIYDKNKDILYMNEVNTIPGSLAFYLFEGLGIDYKFLCELLLDNCKDIKKQAYFDSDILSKTGFKVK